MKHYITIANTNENYFEKDIYPHCGSMKDKARHFCDIVNGKNETDTLQPLAVTLLPFNINYSDEQIKEHIRAAFKAEFEHIKSGNILFNCYPAKPIGAKGYCCGKHRYMELAKKVLEEYADINIKISNESLIENVVHGENLPELTIKFETGI